MKLTMIDQVKHKVKLKKRKDMKREERITEICKQCNDMLGESLANAIAHAISEGYKLGLEENKQIIDKIVKWLDDNAFEYVKTETFGINVIYKGFDSEKMITDLIKAMT